MKKLGLGIMRLPLTDPEDKTSVDVQATQQMVDRFMENGFNYFDTGYAYHGGVCEKVFRQTVAEKYPRDSFVLAGKMPTWLIKSHEDYERIFSEQLENCGVSYFDRYLLHNLTRANLAITLEHGGFDVINKLKAEGKIKELGVSFHDTPEVLEEILKRFPEIDFVQLQINYVDWENKGIRARECYELSRKYGKFVIVMEPVKGGSLASVPDEAQAIFDAIRPGASCASWGIRFAASLEGVDMVLSGMSSIEQVEDNIRTMDHFEPFTGAEYDAVFKAAEILNKTIAIPCTACGYCTERCPQDIPIPRYFSLYNNQRQFKLVPSIQSYYDNMAGSHRRASDCVQCRQCEKSCPQHIEIVNWLEETAKVFEPQA